MYHRHDWVFQTAFQKTALEKYVYSRKWMRCFSGRCFAFLSVVLFLFPWGGRRRRCCCSCCLLRENVWALAENRADPEPKRVNEAQAVLQLVGIGVAGVGVVPLIRRDSENRDQSWSIDRLGERMEGMEEGMERGRKEERRGRKWEDS